MTDRTRGLDRTRRGFWLIALAVAGSLAAAGASAVAAIRGHEWVQHTIAVQYALSDLLVAALDVETGARGYVLTGRSEYLEPFVRGSGAVDERLHTIEELVQDNPSQQARVAGLRELITKRVAEAGAGVASRRGESGGAAQALIARGSGKQFMDGIRRVIADMNAEEQRLLASRSAASRTRTRVAVGAWFVVASVLLVAGVEAVIVGRRLRRELGEADRAAAVAELARRVAHEMNSPLAASSANLEFALELAAGDAVRASARAELVGALADALAATRLASAAVRSLQDATGRRAAAPPGDRATPLARRPERR